MKKVSLFLSLLLISQPGHSFNLWQDIEQNTQWTLGHVVNLGTAYDINKEAWVGTALAQISSYRFLSLSYGVSNLPQKDTPAVKITDTSKIGFNVGYFLRHFVNQPPELIRNLDIGPAVACPIFSNPRPIDFLIDINYRFGAFQ